MKYRQLGRTGINVSEIGFGCWAIGKDMWGQQDDRDSVEALNKALDLGCTFFDTALRYGDGHSEMLVGKAMKDRGCLNDVVIATKVPPKNLVWSPPLEQPIKEAFPADWIKECCDKSLANLGRDYLDVLQLHTWNKSWDNETEWHDALLKLKDEGKIRAFGVSASGARHDEVNPHVMAGRVDTIQVVYNIIDQNVEKTLFPLAGKQGTGIIARQPLAAGGLTGKFTKETHFKKGDWRGENKDREWLLGIVDQVDKVSGVIQGSMPLYEAALKFCLSDKAVSTVIPGARNAEQTRLNFGILEDNKELTREQLAALRRLWSSGKIGGLDFV